MSVPVVPQAVRGMRARAVDRGRGAHSSRRDPGAEDGPAGCGADPEADAGGPVSVDLGADGGGARSAAVADGSSPSHANADQGEEPAAGAGAEPGSAEGAAAVVDRGPAAVAGYADDGARGPTSRSVAE